MQGFSSEVGSYLCGVEIALSRDPKVHWIV
jgi:hypothetical protein